MENSSDFEKNSPIVPIVIIVGPTSIGKSKVAMDTARLFNGAIVNADSRQVYRYMDIGTAKPSKEDMEMVELMLLGNDQVPWLRQGEQAHQIGMNRA